jgi:hypothetical protein
MKERKKIIITLIVLLSINFALFAKTTIVRTDYNNRGASYLFNDIYSSLMVTGVYTNPILETETDNIFKVGANFNSSVFFKDFPVGIYSGVDFIPIESDVYMVDVIFGIATRTNTGALTESYFNFGPAISIIGEDENAQPLFPYTLVYWGGALNAGYRVAGLKEFNALTIDVGATAKALWYDSGSSENASLMDVRDFRYSFNAYIGFTFRWFAPDLGEGTNIIFL